MDLGGELDDLQRLLVGVHARRHVRDHAHLTRRAAHRLLQQLRQLAVPMATHNISPLFLWQQQT